jgi:PatG C-terminal
MMGGSPIVDGETSGQTIETIDESVVNPVETASAPSDAPVVAAPSAALPTAAPAFVYALGQIEPRFPSLAIEKEFAQAIGSLANAGLTDRQTLRRAIAAPQNRYLARSLCWVFLIEGLETYILVPGDPADLALLVEAYREEPRRDDLDAVIGVRSHIASPEMCNGLALPVVVFDQLYSFDRDSLIESIPKPDSVSDKELGKFRSAAGGLFDQLLQIADNAGAIDEHRALNYLLVRYPRIYAVTTEQFERNFSFTGVEVIPSRLSGARAIVDVVFSFRHRETDVGEKQFARVDVTEEFPFLVTKMSPYYDR